MTEPQHMRHLALANEYRLRRAQFGEEIKAGEVVLSEILRQPTLPAWLRGERVDRLLCRVHRLGPKRINRMLANLHIHQKRRVGDLTNRQRRELSDRLAREEVRWSGSGERAIDVAKSSPAWFGEGE